MNNIELVKRAVEDSERFELCDCGRSIKSVHNNMEYPISAFILNRILYPDFLQSAIEGINKKHLNDNKYPVTIIDAWDIEIRFYSSGYKDFVKGLDNWDSIEEAKEEALKHIYEVIS